MNKLYFGDNLDMLREKIKDESVDLVYLDPPFKSNANYNVLFKPGGVVSEAQAEAFRDTWEWAAGRHKRHRRGGSFHKVRQLPRARAQVRVPDSMERSRGWARDRR